MHTSNWITFAEVYIMTVDFMEQGFIHNMIWTLRWWFVQWFLPFTSRHPLIMTFTHLDQSHCFMINLTYSYMEAESMKQIHTVALMWNDLMRKECLHTTSEIKFACIITNTVAIQEELYVTLKLSQLVYIHVAYILQETFQIQCS